ncbi:MAG: M23 family metallopeptidase [Deltaproteobacteria bacterium]|nr:MAG: M23 family metallopeptidase [Deltaproteobacteria bacterium]
MITSAAPRTATGPVVIAPERRTGPSAIVRVEPIHRSEAVVGARDRVPTGMTANAIDVRPRERDHAPAVEPRRVTPAPGGGDIVLPYPVTRIFRGFGACRGDRHYHEGIDIGGIGPEQGLGTPIRAMTRSRVTLIGRGEDDPGEFGRKDKRGGTTRRGGHELPRSRVVDGYGRVYFFTLDKGRWRSGDVVVTEGVGGRLDKHEIRYMHLGAVRPGLKVGDILEPGEELGVMGGTGVQESSPHLHLDIEDPEGRAVDVAPLLGLEPTARQCPEKNADGREARVWSRTVKVPRCSVWERQEDFESGEYYAHDVTFTLDAGQSVDVALNVNGGAWSPQIMVRDGDDKVIFDGANTTRASRGSAVKVRRRASGKRAKKAALELTAREKTKVTVRVTAWPQARSGLLLPKDGEYALTIGRPCDS